MALGTAVVTGASAGIGEATVRHLRNAGFDVVMGARRLDRLEEIAADTGATALRLDVTDDDSVEEFAGAIGECDVLVNNAGGAIGMDPIAEGSSDDWLRMYDLNVVGTMRVTRSLLPKVVASGDGRIVNLCSTAGLYVYEGGGGYTSVKHGERAMTRTLRLELLGQPVRVIEVSPGMVETDFSLTRFGGDRERAAKVYEGVTPLVADDVAECITWAVTRPGHVNIDTIVVTPRDQGPYAKFSRR